MEVRTLTSNHSNKVILMHGNLKELLSGHTLNTNNVPSAIAELGGAAFEFWLANRLKPKTIDDVCSQFLEFCGEQKPFLRDGRWCVVQYHASPSERNPHMLYTFAHKANAEKKWKQIWGY